MTNSKSIYKDHAIGGTEGTYLVYILYRDSNIPHYVGATSKSSRPYSKDHKARQGHSVTSVEIVQERMTLEDASNLEDQMINHYGKIADGGTLINIQGGGHGLATEETKTKISQSLKGRPSPNKGRRMSEETRAKMSASQKGRTHSDESKAKISASQKGRVMTDEHKAKLKAAWDRRKQLIAIANSTL